ncbi:MAG TPA: (2Fe-2S)-binding protein [Stellaceae bacterium]|nr:(2Fe-2S)-binding protein [Stellaceae bacterium]
MFRRLQPAPATVGFFLDGAPCAAAAGDSVAAALLAAGIAEFSAAPRHGAPRGPYCMIGQCYGCLVEIDGMPYRQACLTPVAEGMQVRRMTACEEPS